ncbi:MAG: ribonuclease P protein component [Pseudomonadota bacterium]
MAQHDLIETGVVRLKTRPQFLFVRSGASERRKSLVVQARRREGATLIGAGFTATQKIGNAVTRNRAKRRMREAARLLLPLHGHAGTDYVFIARMDTATIGWQRLLDDMESALISLAQQISAGTGPA